MVLLIIVIACSFTSFFLLSRVSLKKLYKGNWGQADAYDAVKDRINFYGNEVFINNNRPELRTRDVSTLAVFRLKENTEIVFYENTKKVKIYKVVSVNENSNLEGWYLHTSIRVKANSEVQMKGVLSQAYNTYDIDTGEKILFEPFMLSV